ncbi:MAG: hypothetical protein EOP04_05805 [Proteobacteria bacterium]|nr:MAG: hypothetical protein EOP04_05805 [Pseudomonadota bacterium]
MSINPWIRARAECSAVIIFVHGLNSNSTKCWKSRSCSWPEIVKEDGQFDGFDIYAPEYFTSPKSADYGMSDCAGALMRSMMLKSTIHNRSAISYRTILIIAHSFGGVIARYVLESHQKTFVGKVIGLLLMASPSLGSTMANIGRSITWFIRHRQLDELRTNSPLLKDLDTRFKRLVHDRDPAFKLHGQEAYEQQRIFGMQVVAERSAALYFADPVHIPMSTHSSIVKPESINDESHLLLKDFCQKYFFEVNFLSVANQFAHTTSIALFDVYDPECKAYYYVREIDRTVAKAANIKCFWLHGSSGVGKTSIIRYLLGGNLKHAVNIYLNGCTAPVADFIIDEMNFAIKSKADTVGSRCGFEDLSKSFLRRASNNGQLCIFLDEVPIGTDLLENLAICEKIANYFHQLRITESDLKIQILVASIRKPDLGHPLLPSKFKEQFQVMEVPDWEATELNELGALISQSEKNEETDAFVNSALAQGAQNPRALKTAVRNSLIAKLK